jgi:hypothetical protein
MENIAAKIRVSLRDGLLELEGSEEFVSKQIENFKDLVAKMPVAPLRQLPESPNSQATIISVDTPATPSLSPQHENTISIEGGSVKILKDIPGTDKSKKMVNATMLYILGKSLLGLPGASFKEIRELCKDHGCLDDSNFARRLRGAKEWLIVESESLVKLTIPGRKQADVLISEMNAS